MSAEDDFMCEDDEEYDLQYSEDSNDEPDVDLENQYYNSKALKETDIKKALESFQKVLDLEGTEKGEWGFKALKQMIKIYFKIGDYENMMQGYKQLLTYIKTAVTRNYSEKSINSILDYISTYSVPALSKDSTPVQQKNLDLLQEFFEATLQALKEAKNERLWFKTNTKLGKLYFDRGEYNKIFKIIRQLHQSCQTDDGEDDLKKGTQLLEIYALEIQVYTAQRNNKKLKQLYENCLHIKSAIPHPLIMGVIRECGGKMHLRQHEYEKAHTDFFEAFKNYDESGSLRRTACLKYLVLANMLMQSDINPFDSQEAKPYKNDPEIIAMTDLVTAYQNGDIVKFESVLERDSTSVHGSNSHSPMNFTGESKDTASQSPTVKTSIMDDPFIREHVEQLIKNIRTQVLMTTLIKPYTRVRIQYLADKLNVRGAQREKEVENLLVTLILDGVLPKGCKIDQIGKVLILESSPNENMFYEDTSIPNLLPQPDNLSQQNVSKNSFDSLNSYGDTNYDPWCNEKQKEYSDHYKTLQKLSDRILELQKSLINKIS